MTCEEVQQELAGGEVAPGLRKPVSVHVDGCPSCQAAQLFFAGVDGVLKTAPLWEPPAGFARSVAARADHLPSADADAGVDGLPGAPTVARLVVEHVLAQAVWRIQGSAWVLRQYWSLLFA